MIQLVIGTSFTGGGYNPPPVTFVASNYNPIEGTTITFTISGITGVSEGTTLYWWIDGTSGQFSRADQFVENIDNDTLQLYFDDSDTLGGTFTLTPNQGDIDFNIYIGYSLYGGFLNLSQNITVFNDVNDFTIEWWQKMETSVGDYDVLFNVGNNLRFSEQLQGNNLTIWTGNSGTGISNQNIPGLYNTWVHFAIVRDSNIIKLYKNGTSLFSSTNNSIIQNNSDVLQIANGSDNYFQGYITNFHFLKDGAKYNGNFTPSTEPLEEIIGTRLLLSVTSSNTTFIDSTGNHVASVIGGTWSSQSPFSDGSGSIYFDGSSYLGFPGSYDWAIDVVESFPFDVTANWGLTTPEVVDETSFITFLESGEDGDGNTNSQTGVVVTDFLLEGNRLRCNVSSTGAVDPKKGAAMNVVLAFANMGVTDVTSFGNLVYDYLYLYGNNISSVDDTSWSIGITGIDLGENSITSFDNVTWPSTLDYLGLYSNTLTSFNLATLPSGITELDLSNCQLTTVDDIVWPGSLQDLYLGNNQIITFNPSVALPSTLIFIGLDNNLIVDFDPSIALPNSLEEIGLNGNQIITFDPSLVLPSSLIYLTLSSNQIVTFDPSQALPNSLQQLYLGGNQIVTFNPSQALPSGLELLEINNNQMTTAGYTASESWANAMSVIPNRGTINFNNNINGVIGINLESILVSKGWTVQGDPALLPFDITANWGLTTPEVVDEASFITFLESGQDGNNNTNSLTNVTITEFSLVNGRLICNLSATGINLKLDKIEISDIVSFGNIIGLQTLGLQGNQIVTFDPTTLPTGLQNLYLNSNQIVTFDPSIALPTGLKILEIRANQIVTFDPSIALPTGLQNLDLGGNQIVTFDPTITLPSGLQRLYLNSNDIVTFDPTQALPNSLQYLVLNGNQIVTFDTSISLPSGLEYLILNSNQIVTFDPSIVLPNSLQQLNLSNNQIVTFDPSIALPNSLQYLGLSNNQIVTFDPTIALPTGLRNLVLGSNQIVTFNPSIALPNSLRVLSLNSNDIVTFDPSIALPNGLLELVLSGNQIVTFDPSNYALPSSLQYLGLSNNQIVTFDPSQALPSSLQYLDLGSNGIVTFDPSIALPNSLLGLYLNSNQIVTFDPSISLPTALRSLLLSSNDIVTFDPTITLPNLLQSLRLESNQMTTAGYTASEPWANAMSVIPNRGTIYFGSNTNSASGTNLQTILISKGWTVNV